MIAILSIVHVPVGVWRSDTVLSNFGRYQRIAPFYDLIDLPFELRQESCGFCHRRPTTTMMPAARTNWMRRCCRAIS